MEISENGFAEGLADLEKTLAERARALVNAWDAAAVTEQSDLVDAVAAVAPKRSGELAGSGFVDRETGEAGFGSNHAWRIVDQFASAVAERAPNVADRMAVNLERFADAGITPDTAPCNWPEAPVTHAQSPRGRRRTTVGARAGAKRKFR